MRDMLEELGHSQPHTKIPVGNTAAISFKMEPSTRIVQIHWHTFILNTIQDKAGAVQYLLEAGIPEI